MRSSGVLMPISSLPSGYSVGNFGEQAYRFVDRLREGGFSYWQILPLTPIDECHSPYKSHSAYAIEPYYLDLEDLYTEGLLTLEELTASRERDEYLCEYDRLDIERASLLKRASARVKDRSRYVSIVSILPEVDNYCKYMALKGLNADKPWYEWNILRASDEDIWP